MKFNPLERDLIDMAADLIKGGRLQFRAKVVFDRYKSAISQQYNTAVTKPKRGFKQALKVTMDVNRMASGLRQLHNINASAVTKAFFKNFSKRLPTNRDEAKKCLASSGDRSIGIFVGPKGYKNVVYLEFSRRRRHVDKSIRHNSLKEDTDAYAGENIPKVEMVGIHSDVITTNSDENIGYGRLTGPNGGTDVPATRN